MLLVIPHSLFWETLRIFRGLYDFMLGFVVWFSVLLRTNFLFLNLSNFSKQTSKHKSMLVGV